MVNLYDLPFDAFVSQLSEWGLSRHYAEKVWAGMYRDYVTELGQIRGLKASHRAVLDAHADLPQPGALRRIDSGDQLTEKLLLSQADDRAIETVLMRFEARRDRPQETARFTACLSTQVGCAMGCVFCATGQMGFTRHLSPGEIVTQVVFINRELIEQGTQLRNIVLMGMGEPLHNYDNTMAAIDILTDPRGIGLGPSKITLSTVGLPDRIRRLADEHRPINLAVSLHGATDEERQALVPPAKRWPLAELIDACRYYVETRQRRIFFEWTLIEMKNDTPEQAHALGRLLQGIDSHVNVIPLNPTGGYGGKPSDPERVKRFQAVLAEYGIPSTVRQRRGIDIAAGCGQLAVEHAG